MEITGTQCRMARAALGLGVRDLAKLADVSPNTITRLERGEDLHARTLKTIQQTLEKAGVEFMLGDVEGVKLRKGRS